MSISIDLTALGAWELTYFHRAVGDPENARIRAPLIDPIELPYLTHERFFIIGATCSDAKPSWFNAGYLYQQLGGIKIDDTVVYEGIGRVPSTEIDYGKTLISLNALQLIKFEKLSDTYRLRFEAFRWIPKISLAVWEYRGTETDSTEELVNAVRAKLETIEFKIDQL
ncbi:MAG: hypothetical protein ACFKPT_13875 [Gloeotrichia echinulata GP01]